MNEIKGFTLSIIVENTFGTLMRIVALFSKRGYNIDTLQVAPMVEDEKFSRIIMTSSADDQIKEQIFRQIDKLQVVKEVKFI